MSSPSSYLTPTHHKHSDDQPLPSKPPVDYSPKAVEEMSIPQEEQGDSQEGFGSRQSSQHHHEHCHSELHNKQPLAHGHKIKAPKDHHFFDAEHPRPPPVSEEERAQIQWGQGKSKV